MMQRRTFGAWGQLTARKDMRRGTVLAPKTADATPLTPAILWLCCYSVLAYEFLIGTPPFLAEQYGVTYERISKVDVKFPATTARGTVLSEEAKDLIRKLLVKNPEKRLKLKELEKHPFIMKHCAANAAATPAASMVKPTTAASIPAVAVAQATAAKQ
jgi:serine/threonine protein kinase